MSPGRLRFHGHITLDTEGVDGSRRYGGRWLTLPQLWIVVVLGAIGVMQLAATPSAIDLAYHVKAGELIVQQRGPAHRHARLANRRQAVG